VIFLIYVSIAFIFFSPPLNENFHSSRHSTEPLNWLAAHREDTDKTAWIRSPWPIYRPASRASLFSYGEDSLPSTGFGRFTFTRRFVFRSLVSARLERLRNCFIEIKTRVGSQ